MEENNPTTEQAVRKPLVATFMISSTEHRYFNRLRQRYFPAERNFLEAHLTLFNALPDESWIVDDLKELMKSQQPFDVTAQAIMSLGNGTAFKITSPMMPSLHQKLQKKWFEFLTSQDRQKRNFHITIQNKVESQAAKKLQAELSEHFEPFHFTVEGIQLWRYHHGPWEYLMTFHFADT